MLKTPAIVAADSGESTLDVELMDVDEASLDECIGAIADLLIAAALAEPSLAPRHRSASDRAHSHGGLYERHATTR